MFESAPLKPPLICKCRSPWETCIPPARKSFYLNPACDLSTWPLYLISPCDPCIWPLCSSAYLQSWVDWTTFHGFAKSTTLFMRQRSVMSACDIVRDFFRSRWLAFLINLVCLLSGWPFYNSKNSKSNGSPSLFGRRNRRLSVNSLEFSIPPMQWLNLVLPEPLSKSCSQQQRWGHWGCFHLRQWHSHTSLHSGMCFYFLFCHQNGRNPYLQ